MSMQKSFSSYACRFYKQECETEMYVTGKNTSQRNKLTFKNTLIVINCKIFLNKTFNTSVIALHIAFRMHYKNG